MQPDGSKPAGEVAGVLEVTYNAQLSSDNAVQQ